MNDKNQELQGRNNVQGRICENEFCGQFPDDVLDMLSFKHLTRGRSSRKRQFYSVSLQNYYQSVQNIQLYSIKWNLNLKT